MHSVLTIMQKILLVDNDREYRQVLATIVRRLGYQAMQADQISEALERLSTQCPDLVITQFTAPCDDSVDIATWLENNLPSVNIPVVIYTSQKCGSWINQASTCGIAEVLTKPISSADLGETLRKYLGSSRSRARPIASPCFEREL
jgi:CheY-like chemotaxis protein